MSLAPLSPTPGTPPVPRVLRRRTRPGVLAVLAGLVATLLLGTAPALAHTSLVEVDPADGADLTRAPSRITLLFNERIDPAMATVALQRADRTTAQLEVTAGERVGELVAQVPARSGDDVPSRWVLTYRVTSADGHPIQGQTTFTVARTDTPGSSGPDAASTTPADTEDGAGRPGWVLLGGAALAVVVALVVGVAVTLAVLARRRRRSTP